MKKYLIRFLVLSIVITVFSSAFAQGKQKIPKDFFMGKWGGTLSGEIVVKQPHKPIKKYPFSIVLIGKPGKLIGPFGGGTPAMMWMNATWPRKFTVVYDSVMCMIFPNVDHPLFNFMYPVSDPATIAEMGYNTIFYLAGFSVQVKNTNLILLTSRGADWEDSWAKGELYRIYTRKDILGKTVHVNELIKTDKFIQREIIVPHVGEVIVRPNSECKFSDEDELNQAFGEIMGKIEKLPPDYDFKVRSPQAVSSVRGTQFITRVEKDGTTTLTVLGGEVEFSDIQKRKTVLLKKNQKSIVEPGGLPFDPVSIDPNQILRWWE